MANIDCILVKLTIKQWNNSRQDAGVTDEIKTLKQLSGKAGRWVKYKMPETAFEGVRAIASQARRDYYEKTLPWDDGCGLLPKTRVALFSTNMECCKTQFNHEVKELADHLEFWKDQAKAMLGKTYNPDEYPESAEAFSSAFSINYHFLPMPAASHFDSEFSSLYGNALEQENEMRIKIAEEELMRRIIDPVCNMAIKLADPKGTFRDTLVENLKEILRAAPGLNITSNLQVTAALQGIEAMIETVDAQTLRDNKIVRKEVAQAAARIVNQFGALGARKFAA